MPETYVSLFVNSAYAKEGELAAIGLLFLFLARMLPIIALSPFLGARVLPNPTKVMLAITLFIVFLPQLLITTTKPLGFNPMLVVYMIKEVFIGLCIGFLISIPFIIVQTAGIIIDHQRGGASLMVNDPTIQNQSSPLGTLYNTVLIVVFYMVDGPFLFIEAIMHSYEVLPVDQFLNPAFFTEHSSFWKMILDILNDVMRLAIQIASPSLIAILMTDVFLGVANRLAPQVQITFLGMPIKSLLGLAVICVGWGLITDEFAKQARIWLNHVYDMIKFFQYVPS